MQKYTLADDRERRNAKRSDFVSSYINEPEPNRQVFDVRALRQFIAHKYAVFTIFGNQQPRSIHSSKQRFFASYFFASADFCLVMRSACADGSRFFKRTSRNFHAKRRTTRRQIMLSNIAFSSPFQRISYCKHELYVWHLRSKPALAKQYQC